MVGIVPNPTKYYSLMTRTCKVLIRGLKPSPDDNDKDRRRKPLGKWSGCECVYDVQNKSRTCEYRRIVMMGQPVC
jgi:hypothetical protein